MWSGGIETHYSLILLCCQTTQAHKSKYTNILLDITLARERRHPVSKHKSLFFCLISHLIRSAHRLSRPHNFVVTLSTELFIFSNRFDVWVCVWKLISLPHCKYNGAVVLLKYAVTVCNTNYILYREYGFVCIISEYYNIVFRSHSALFQ